MFLGQDEHPILKEIHEDEDEKGVAIEMVGVDKAIPDTPGGVKNMEPSV